MSLRTQPTSTAEPDIKVELASPNRETPVRALVHIDPVSSRIATMGVTSVARQPGKKQASAAKPATIPVEYKKGNGSSMLIPKIFVFSRNTAAVATTPPIAIPYTCHLEPIAQH